MSNIIRWNPVFPEFFEDIRNDINNRGFTPAIDIYQTDKEVVVEMPLPNVDPDKVDIEVSNDMLTVSGKNEHTSEVDEKNYYRREIRRGSFQRSVMLPAHVDDEKANAKYQKGVLVVTLPKKDAISGKKIKINASE